MPTPRVARRQTVLKLADPTIYRDPVYYWWEDDNDILEELYLRRADWVELGMPGFVTVTIEPGDRLNDD